jgi:hypothetical protein
MSQPSPADTAESVSKAKELLARYNTNIAREEDLIEAYSNLQESYTRVEEGTTEEDDFKALAWDMAQAQKLLQQEENIPEDQYKNLFNLYEEVEEEVREGELNRSDNITEYRHRFFETKQEINQEDLQEAVEALENK